LKLAEIVVVLMLGYIKDEWTFFMLAFIKDKLHNKLSPHLDTIVYMFAQELYIQCNLFLSRDYYNLEGSKSLDWGYHLACSIFFTTQDSSVRVSMILTSLMIVLGFLLGYEVY
jgi:hypothetical protein